MSGVLLGGGELRRIRAPWIVAGLVVGALARVVIPAGPPEKTHHVRLTIVATGKKNPAASASEVWVFGLFDADGDRLVAPTAFTRTGAWAVRDGVVVSHEHQPATLSWDGALPGAVELRLLSHPWSGVVRVESRGGTQRLDLYAPTEGVKRLRLVGGRPRAWWTQALLEGAMIVTLGALALVLLLWLASRPAKAPPAPVSRWAWAAFAVPCALVWTIYLLAFWPGAMTSDSFDQWAQIISGRFNDWHCFTHTAFLWLMTRVWMSPAPVVGAQIIALSAVTGWILARFSTLGMPRPLAWVLCGLFAVIPGTSIVLVLWKDVPHSIAVLALTMLVLDVVSSGGECLRRWSKLLLLGTVATLMALLRSNAPLAAFGTLALLVLGYRRQWRGLALTLALSVGVWWGLRQIVFPGLGVGPAAPKLTWWYAHQIAAQVAGGTPVTPEEKDVLRRMVPDRDGVLSYDPYRIDATVFDGHFRTGVLLEPGPLRRLWWTLLRRNPSVSVRHWVKASQSVWRVTHPPGMHLATIPLGRDGEGHMKTIFGGEILERIVPPALLRTGSVPVTSPMVPSLTMPVGTWLMASAVPAWSWLCWGSGLYLYVAIGGGVLAAVRTRTWTYLLVLAPVCLTALGLALFAVSSEFRFVSPIFMVGMLFGPFLLWVPRSPPASPDQNLAATSSTPQ